MLASGRVNRPGIWVLVVFTPLNLLSALERSFLSLNLGFPPSDLRGCQGLNELGGHN